MRAHTLVLLGLLAAGCARQPVVRWRAVTIPTDATFDALCFTDSLNGWIGGGSYLVDGGILGRTRDGGRTWSFQSGVLPDGGTGFSLESVQFEDTLRGCAVGSGGVVLVTVDGGTSWRETRRGRSSGDGLGDLQMVDGRHGWAVGSASLVRTDDGGETWRPLVYGTSENGYFSGNAIHFTNLQRGWLAARGGTLLHTEDGGVHWEPAALPLRPGERPALWDVTFTDDAHGWVVGEAGAIFHTEDHGATWVRQENGVPIVRRLQPGEKPRRDIVPELETVPDRLNLAAVRFTDPLHGRAVGYYADVGESVVIATDDGGASWRIERIQPGEELRALFVLDAAHAWAVGDRARVEPQVVLRYASEVGP
jgi:photosystem II stability/assembly factor-like uncharacterized protein